MKNLLRKLAIVLSFTPMGALALDAGNCPPDLRGTASCPSGGLKEVITTISNTILLLVGVVAVLFLILGGFQYVTSGGNPEQVNKAKNTILYAIIGIVAALIAYVAVTFVLENLA